MDFYELLLQARLTPKKAANYLQLSLRTIQRYIEAGTAPRPVWLALSWLAGANPDWPGWKFQNGWIERPGRPRLHRNQVDQYEYMQYLQFMRGREFNTEEPARLADNVLFFRKKK